MSTESPDRTPRAEQETTMKQIRDEVALVHTSNLPHLRRLRKLAASHDFIREIRGGDDWAEFEVAAENFSPLMAVRPKRKRSEAQIAASRAQGERFAAKAVAA